VKRTSQSVQTVDELSLALVGGASSIMRIVSANVQPSACAACECGVE